MRKLLLSLMILIGILTAKAANFGYLTFEMTGGEKVSVPTESLKMTISGTTLIAGTKTFVIANLVKMYFSTSDESTTDVDRIDSTTLDEAEEKKGFAERQLWEAQAAYQELHGQWSEKKGAVDTLRKGIHGQPLLPEEIHYQFEQRERQAQEMRQQARGEQEKARTTQLHIGSIWESCQDYDSCFDSVETKALPLEQDFVAQWKTLRKTYEQMERERKEMLVVGA